MNKNIYLVSDGQAFPADENAEWDGVNSILVLAETPEIALMTAQAYDDDLIGPDNHIHCGAPVVAVVAPEAD